MFGLKRASKELVGVDIGSSSVKAVQLRKKGRSFELANVGLAEVSPDAVVDGAIMDALSVSSAIQKVFSDNRIEISQVATSVSGSAVMVKRITVPAESEEQLAEAVPAEAQRQLSSDPSELNLDYQLLGPALAPKALDVMLVAARREKVSGYTGVLSQAGKTPMVVDVDVFALQNAFENSYEPPPDQIFALLNVGASLTNVNIVRDGVPLFTRDIAVGGSQYTEALRKAFDLSFEEAEAVKLGGEHPKVTAEQRQSALQSVSGSVVAELRRTFNFFNQLTDAGSVDRIYVGGGTARLAGLAERIQDELKIPVEILDPLRRIGVPASGFDAEYVAALAPRLTVAVGLALRSFDAT